MPTHRRKPYPVPPEIAPIAARIKSIVRNTLLASPYFPRFYADVVIADAPNSNEGKILARYYQKIVERTTMPNVTDCTHIKVNGVRCGSPALRGEQFCYFHQRMHRGVRTPPQSRLHPIALIEDEESIQASLMEVINALMRNTIDLKRAELILRALHIAVRNSKRVSYSVHNSDMIKEIPDYPAPQKDAAATQEKTDLDFPPTAAIAPPRPPKEPDFWERWESGAGPDRQSQVLAAAAAHLRTTTAHVGTAAPGCPGGPAVSGRTAVEPKSPTPSLPRPSQFSKGETPVPDPTRRKPPSNVKPAPAPKERKTSAGG